MLSIFFIGIALSMDAFSVALSYGSIGGKTMLFPFFVGIMHFIMPLMGNYLGNLFIFNVLNINPKLVVSIILIILAYVMSHDSEKYNIVVKSLISIIVISFSVSLDSFSVGVGLSGLNNNVFLSSLIFSLCSGCITYVGLIVGKYVSNVFNNYARYIGAGLLIVISIVNLCQFLYN